jgi:hypothetical protein
MSIGMLVDLSRRNERTSYRHGHPIAALKNPQWQSQSGFQRFSGRDGRFLNRAAFNALKIKGLKTCDDHFSGARNAAAFKKGNFKEKSFHNVPSAFQAVSFRSRTAPRIPELAGRT